MRISLFAAPLVALFMVSCQPSTPIAQTLPSVVKKRPLATKPKTTSTRELKKKADEAALALAEKAKVDPLEANPLKVTPQVTDIPRFEVPENVQPKVTDGINQGLFIELKW